MIPLTFEIGWFFSVELCWALQDVFLTPGSCSLDASHTVSPSYDSSKSSDIAKCSGIDPKLRVTF